MPKYHIFGDLQAVIKIVQTKLTHDSKPQRVLKLYGIVLEPMGGSAGLWIEKIESF